MDEEESYGNLVILVLKPFGGLKGPTALKVRLNYPCGELSVAMVLLLVVS